MPRRSVPDPVAGRVFTSRRAHAATWLLAAAAVLLLTGCSLGIAHGFFASRQLICTVPSYPISTSEELHQHTYQVPATCTTVYLYEVESGWILQVKQSTDIAIPMQDWFNGDIDNITDSNTHVLAPDSQTQSILNGHGGSSATALHFEAAEEGTATIVEENHNQDESFGVMINVS